MKTLKIKKNKKLRYFFLWEKSHLNSIGTTPKKSLNTFHLGLHYPKWFMLILCKLKTCLLVQTPTHKGFYPLPKNFNVNFFFHISLMNKMHLPVGTGLAVVGNIPSRRLMSTTKSLRKSTSYWLPTTLSVFLSMILLISSFSSSLTSPRKVRLYSTFTDPPLQINDKHHY